MSADPPALLGAADAEAGLLAESTELVILGCNMVAHSAHLLSSSFFCHPIQWSDVVVSWDGFGAAGPAVQAGP